MYALRSKKTGNFYSGYNKAAPELFFSISVARNVRDQEHGYAPPYFQERDQFEIIPVELVLGEPVR